MMLKYRWIGIGFGVIFLASLLFQIWQFYLFIGKGPRFTAQDGQELCQIVRVIAIESYGFQSSGRTLPDCHYQ